MTVAIVYLIAAIITLVATSIPLVTALVKWGSGKGILRMLFSAALDFVGLAFFVLWAIG